MGTLENLSALVEELRGSRGRLEALAARTAGLERRLREDAPTIVSLDKLAHQHHPPLAAPDAAERFEGDETSLASDAWEISLITEDVK